VDPLIERRPSWLQARWVRVAMFSRCGRSPLGKPGLAVELGGTANTPTVAAVCAFRTDDASANAPLAGLQIQRGLQRLLLKLDPRSVDRLEANAVPLPGGVLDHVESQVSTANSLFVEQTHL
jgi:hypothetical protein